MYTLTERPRLLSQVVGQKVVVESFKTRFQKDKLNIPQVIMLEGSTGQGKSSIANIIATTIQCEKPNVNKEGYIEPCLTCSNCKDIIEEKFIQDTHFIPASMDNGKEVIASIEELITYMPSFGNYKIIMIGEIQNLTSSAKTSLLELIEKPRKNVIFIFTTMDSSKIDRSVKDRCQVYKLKAVNQEDLTEHIINVLEKYNELDKPETFFSEVIPCITQNSKGSVRNALSLLEQCIISKLYTEKDLIENIGIITENTIDNLLYKLLKKDFSVLGDFRDLELEEFFRISRYNLINALTYKLYSKNDSDNYMVKKFIALSKYETLEDLIKTYIEADEGLYKFNKDKFLLHICLYLQKDKKLNEVKEVPTRTENVRQVRS